ADSCLLISNTATPNVSPLADAGDDRAVLPGETVELDGGGSSDLDGNPLAFRWAITEKPPQSTATLANSSTVMPTFEADLQGQYQIQLVVNDGMVDSGPDTVTVMADISRPIADAGTDQTVQVGDTVNLDGDGSRGPQGRSLTFQWSLIAVPDGSAAVLSSPTVATPTFVADLAGNYQAQLIVTDGAVNSDPDTVNITATSAAANRQAIQCGDLVSGTIEVAAETDIFTFTADADNVVSITLSETSGFTGTINARVALFSPQGGRLGLFDSNSQRQFTLVDSGGYVLQINADNLTATGTYTLGLECLIPPSPDAVALNCGDLLSGSIEAVSEVDLFTFTAVAGDTVSITLSETDGFTGFINARATLFSPQGGRLGLFDSNSQRQFTLADSGSYIIQVNADNLTGTGAYNLGLQCL
ncbi:MAG: hypothetical protein GY807_12100, partial [Gammaproteobacteria bacterium]|nr:hypothetical protein [Gammaproteobacteria bacterium]